MISVPSWHGSGVNPFCGLQKAIFNVYAHMAGSKRKEETLLSLYMKTPNFILGLHPQNLTPPPKLYFQNTITLVNKFCRGKK